MKSLLLMLRHNKLKKLLMLLKLQALKSAMEGRRAAPGPAAPDTLLARLLQQATLSEDQLERRKALLQALRERGSAQAAG